MRLKEGPNTLVFEVLQDNPTARPITVASTIFLWPPTCKIVVSDVDGTITKSDVLGHIMYMVGRDWTHAGVAKLFTNVAASGYRMLYLTSRAIGQNAATKQYLFDSVAQDGLKLPRGPVITSPDRLFAAFTREVIQRRPQVGARAPSHTHARAHTHTHTHWPHRSSRFAL